MRDLLKRAVMAACLGVVSLLFVGSAYAASLGKIEVTSHIGEPFYAEVPLQLDADELVSKVFIEIADAGDYRIFEVYRDPVLKSIRADVASDKRGARVQLSSRTTITTPFFNLVLKIRTGRVSYFRKYPVFLDAGKAMQSVAAREPQPSVVSVPGIENGTVVKPATASSGQVFAPVQPAPDVAEDKADNWARTDKYGPIVRGDSLSTIASRLRVDHRYSLNQTMVALFDKNQGSFDKQNMNLLKAGSVLKVPSAAEVEMHSKHEALRILADHEKAWKKLTEQPHYAAAAEEQRTRYSPRVSVGKQADVAAAAPAASSAPASVSSAPTEPAMNILPHSADSQTSTLSEGDTRLESGNTVLAQTNELLTDIQEKNDQLQQQLSQSNQNMKVLQDKIDTLAIESSKARIEKLEILIARLQNQQEQERPSPAAGATADWIVWLLTALVLILIAIVIVLLRREPVHPGATASLNDQPDTEPVIPATEPSASDALAATIENEVSEIEEEAIRTSEYAATDSLVDALSDTATAELEPFNASVQARDPEIDYVSEADVYIRYGMNEEALQQLDMALRLQPDNVKAHIRKAEILLGKNDKQGFDETMAIATLALSPIDLARFRTSVTDLGGDVDELVPLPADEALIAEQETGSATLQIDDSDIDDLDFELNDSDDVEVDQAGKLASRETVEPAEKSEQAAEELDWLFDDAFDSEKDHSEEVARPVSVEKLVTAEQRDATEHAMTGKPADGDMGATMRLDQLFGEFYSEDDDLIEFEDQANKASDKEPVGVEKQIDEADKATDENVSATMHLDQLLGEFDNDEDDLIRFDDEDDQLAFSKASDGLDASFFEQGEADQHDEIDAIDIEADHCATQELDTLLSEFAEDDAEFSSTEESDLPDSNSIDSARAEDDGDQSHEGATQVLGHLLDEFSDLDKDAKKR